MKIEIFANIATGLYIFSVSSVFEDQDINSPVHTVFPHIRPMGIIKMRLLFKGGSCLFVSRVVRTFNFWL